MNLEHMRHSLAHLLASAVKELYPDAKPTIGPAIENGFYYDFDFQNADSAEHDAELRRKIPGEKDLEKIEKKMKELLPAWKTFHKIEVTPEEAQIIFADNLYKIELINEHASAGKSITLYYSGPQDNIPSKEALLKAGSRKLTAGFVDLCRGGHVENPAQEISPDSFKLDRIAGAYWRGSEDNTMLTRIYGLAFENKKALETYEWQVEEAKKRDHRKIGKEMKLFTISDLVGPGLPLMQPNGMIIRKEIEDYLWELHKNRGYSRVWTPHLAKEALYETSGHASKFGEELFRVHGGDEQFFMKPMNCPHHMQIFADNQFSYRDMPVRYFEPATVYRYEKAGQLAGLTRVRAITQDDGHLFCRVSHIGEEVNTIVSIITEFYKTMHMLDGYWVRLSVRGDDTSKYLGGDDVWEKAESALEASAKENNLNYKIGRDEAAFYGPKLDFMFKDAIGREWQLATIQCDFNLPERFDLSFTNEQGEKERPVVIHRAISGSLERFMGVMIEHFAGHFPLWLAPVQVKILPIGEAHFTYGEEVLSALSEAGLRAELDVRSESLGKKIRSAKEERVPYMFVIGDKEVDDKTVTIEGRNEKIGTKTIAEAVAYLQEIVAEKK